jgi:multidrug efflux pump subunit AcrB
MNTPIFAIKHWRLTVVVLALIFGLGWQALRSMPRSVDPHVDFPFSTVTVILPGASAGEMEESVAKPIEDVLQGLENVREVRSNSSDGLAVISAEYDYGTNPEQSLDKAITQVNGIRSSLPSGIAKIEFTRPRPTEAAVIQLAMVSDGASWRRLEKYTRDLTERIGVIGGVRNTLVTGLRKPEVQVVLDSGKLAELKLPASSVTTAIANAGADVAIGAVHLDDRRLNLVTGGAFRDLQRIRDIPLRSDLTGNVLSVGDVAQVDWGVPEQTTVTRYNGRRAVFVAVRQKDTASAIPLRDAVVDEVRLFRQTLPPDIKLEVGFDQSQEIRQRLNELGREFMAALALVLLTLSPLGKRPAIVVMVSIPASMAIGVWILSALDFGLDQISIAGFVIALGLVVDDSIVVVENVARHLRSGVEPEQAAVAATNEISAAVLGSTGVLIFAFLPLAFLPDAAGDFVRGLPIAVIATVAGSLIISLTAIPVLASRLLRRGEHAASSLALNWINGGIERFYEPLLRKALDRPGRAIVLAVALCLAAMSAIPLVGFSLFPAADVPQLLAQVELPAGSGVAASDRAVRQVSQIISREHDVVARMESAGRGNPQVFYNRLPRDEQANYGEVFFTLKNWDPVDGPALIERLRTRFDRYPDARVTIVQFENGTPIEAPIVIRIEGPELVTLKALSARIAAIMKETEGLRDVRDPMAADRLDLVLNIDEAKAAALGIAAGEVKRAVRLAISGERVANFRDADGISYPVTVRLPIEDRQDFSALSAIDLSSQSGRSIPLSDLADPKLTSQPSQITRMRLSRFVAVSAQTKPGVLASEANALVLSRLTTIKLPPGYRLRVGGQAEDAARSTAGIGGIALITFVGILGILILEFRRFKNVLIVLGVIPLGLVGGIFALLCTGNSLSFFAAIGFVALIGIEIKNAILLVDFTSRLQNQGVPLREAIEEAGRVRFLPVLLTSVTAIAALLPLAVSGQALYSPLAWVIIGGLISSTIMSRIIIPALHFFISRH